jgi:hypothetical protein
MLTNREQSCADVLKNVSAAMWIMNIGYRILVSILLLCLSNHVFTSDIVPNVGLYKSC